MFYKSTCKYRKIPKTEKKEQIEKKIANCNQAISINPNSADAYYNRGAVYDDLKEYHKAIEDYNKTINLDSKHVEAYYNRGFANKKLGKYQQALEDCTQFIDLFPKSAVAYNNRAVLHYDFSRLGPACADWQKACELGDCTGLNWGKNVGHCK